MNKCFFVGRLITDPSFRQAGGVEVCDYKISVRTRGKNDQGYPNSIIVKCTAWRKLAEMCKSFGLYKGQMVGVTGMLDLEQYTDKNGVLRSNLTLDVDDMDFIRLGGDMPGAAPVRGDADDVTGIPAVQAVQDPDCPF
jgi:single stranded DNA-binding protein